MADTEKKQISATIDLNLANDVQSFADMDNRSFSQMVEILLKKGIGTALVANGKKKAKAK